jgi:microcystin-dependent protein
VATAAAGDYVQVFWAGDNTGLTVEALPAGTNPVYPAVPSIILTATQVGNSGLVVSPNAPLSTGVLWLDTDETSDIPVPIGGTAGQVLAKIDSVNYNTQWINQIVAPAGVISQFAGTTAPIGYLLCQGQTLSTTLYPDLFAVLQYAYGGGGSSFKIPDLQGRIPVGRDTTQSEFDALGESGGAKTHALTIAEMPSHTHTTPNHSHTFSATTSTAGNHSHVLEDSYLQGVPVGGGSTVFAGNRQYSGWGDTRYVQAAGNHTHTLSGTTSNSAPTTNSTGSGTAHNNLQPYIVVNYIIKT